jgi:hypothetical protein
VDDSDLASDFIKAMAAKSWCGKRAIAEAYPETAWLKQQAQKAPMKIQIGTIFAC